MPSDTEKLLSNALGVFNEKLSNRQVIKLEGMEDYLKVPQYKALVDFEKKISQIEMEAVTRIMNSKIAYLKAAQELRACEMRWFEEIRHGMESLEERNKIVKDVNMKMRKGDYSILKPAPTTSIQNSPKIRSKPPMSTIREVPRSDPSPIIKEAKPELADIKSKLAMMNLDSTTRSPLKPLTINKNVEISTTPKIGPTLSSKGSLDGSVVHNRAPTTPLSHSMWNVPQPNFDDTIDTEPTINQSLRGAHHRPLPSALLKCPSLEEEEEDDKEDTFPLSRPSLPFQTPTVPNSRPFLLSSMKKEEKRDELSRPPRPVPTPLSSARSSTTDDPLNSLGLMKLKRPILNSEVGKKLMGQL